MKRPSRTTKTNKTVDRLVKQSQCRECSVVVTKMDFAKILGKFTKVKIQYESNTPAKQKKVAKAPLLPRTAVNNSRLKRNENGMVQIHRSAYNKHPVKKLLSPKGLSNSSRESSSPQALNNILKENNRLKKSTPLKEKKVSQNKKNNNKSSKHYHIIFENPKIKGRETRNVITLSDLVPSIDDSLLPSGEWCMEFLPKSEEPRNDKVYDRIAAELEDLMSNGKDSETPVKEAISNKGDDISSIFDILTDNTDVKGKNKNGSSSKTTASDVESILLGKVKSPKKSSELNDSFNEISSLDEPGSPSILDEALQTGVEKQIPGKLNESSSKNAKSLKKETTLKTKSKVTHVIFKHLKGGKSYKTVRCPKNLKYGIDIDGKPVELLGAPKFITSLEDLRVLLQIVHESETGSFYIVQPNT